VKASLTEGDIYVHPSDLDACPVSVMEGQTLVDLQDTQSWVESISYLLEHPDERREIGSHGRRFVERRFSTEP